MRNEPLTKGVVVRGSPPAETPEAALLATLRGHIRRMAKRYACDTDDAESDLGYAITIAILQIEAGTLIQSLPAYVYRIWCRTMSDARRKKARQVPVEKAKDPGWVHSAAPEKDDDPPDEPMITLLTGFLNDYPLLAKRIREGKSLREIGQEMGMSAPTVKVQLSALYKFLRKQIEGAEDVDQ